MSKNTDLNQQLIMASLRRFYSDPANAAELDAAIGVGGTSDAGEGGRTKRISLRLVDHFVTNYCRTRHVTIDRMHHSVDVEYNNQLKSYSKKNFDPFKRGVRIGFSYDNDRVHVETTIGQLNFFMWAIKFGVMSYIRENAAAVSRSMMAAAEGKSDALRGKGAVGNPSNRVSICRKEGVMSFS
jgi:hypothetical protein